LKYISQAPGKIIITGEHFVVHGGFALAAAINKFVKVTAEISPTTKIISKTISGSQKNIDNQLQPLYNSLRKLTTFLNENRNLKITIDSDIPYMSGLGSSGSVSVSLINSAAAALGHALNDDELFKFSMISEKIIHGNPSGIDITVPIKGGAFLFKKGKDIINVEINKLEFIVVLSGIQSDTYSMIKKVHETKTRNPKIFDLLVKSSSLFSQFAASSIKNQDYDSLGSVMNFHQTALNYIGVSNNKLDYLITMLLKYGAQSAKLTGSGGGGAIIALAPTKYSSKIINNIKKLGYNAFLVKLPVKGVDLWKK
tara:strand:- start:215 stop:1147 length:933 start_codon:yes stop_codon:yes gene_type:complete